MGVWRRPGSPTPGRSAGLLLLLTWTCPARQTALPALAHHPHLCQATREADGRYFPGFFCPRLSDSPEEAYCCRLRAAGGYCCARAEFEALYQVNLSSLAPPPVLRGPGPLLALGLYSLLLLALVIADLLHFCRGRGGRGPRRRPPCPSSPERGGEAPRRSRRSPRT
ncbi:protein shisa-like-1 [Thomomys bottae]